MAAICILDAAGMLTIWNEASAPMLGGAAEVPEAVLEKAGRPGWETEWSSWRANGGSDCTWEGNGHRPARVRRVLH